MLELTLVAGRAGQPFDRSQTGHSGQRATCAVTSKRRLPRSWQARDPARQPAAVRDRSQLVEAGTSARSRPWCSVRAWINNSPGEWSWSEWYRAELRRHLRKNCAITKCRVMVKRSITAAISPHARQLGIINELLDRLGPLPLATSQPLSPWRPPRPHDAWPDGQSTTGPPSQQLPSRSIRSHHRVLYKAAIVASIQPTGSGHEKDSSRQASCSTTVWWHWSITNHPQAKPGLGGLKLSKSLL